jgi:hypothetical protein
VYRSSGNVDGGSGAGDGFSVKVNGRPGGVDTGSFRTTSLRELRTDRREPAMEDRGKETDDRFRGRAYFGPCHVDGTNSGSCWACLSKQRKS